MRRAFVRMYSSLCGFGMLDRQLGAHRQPVALQAGDLLRVVREEADLREAQVDEDLRADAVVAQVRREAEDLVRLDGVEALVLQA